MDDTRKPTEIEIVAWARLLKASAKLLACVERDLKEAGLPPLAWYDALLELHRARPRRAEARRPASRRCFCRSTTSRGWSIGCEAAGYAVRRPHPQDGRGQVLQITGDGDRSDQAHVEGLSAAPSLRILRSS